MSKLKKKNRNKKNAMCPGKVSRTFHLLIVSAHIAFVSSNRILGFVNIWDNFLLYSCTVFVFCRKESSSSFLRVYPIVTHLLNSYIQFKTQIFSLFSKAYHFRAHCQKRFWQVYRLCCFLTTYVVYMSKDLLS